MRNEFDLFVRDFCELVGLPDAQAAINGGPISVNGVVFSVIFDDRAGPDRLFMYGDFGPLPSDKRAQALEELMKHNFLHFTGRGPCFSFSPITGHVVYIETFSLDRDTPEALADAMAAVSAMATEWRGTYFLTGPHKIEVGNTTRASASN